MGWQYESAFARSAGGAGAGCVYRLRVLPVVRCLAPEGRCPCRLRAAPRSSLPFAKGNRTATRKPNRTDKLEFVYSFVSL